MAYEVGVDVVEVDRIDRLRRAGALRGAFTAAELSGLGGNTRLTAEALAVKEAVAKAFGTGFAADISWKDIEVLRSGRGWQVRLHRGAERAARERSLLPVVSSGSRKGLALAMACLEPCPEDRGERAGG